MQSAPTCAQPPTPSLLWSLSVYQGLDRALRLVCTPLYLYQLTQWYPAYRKRVCSLASDADITESDTWSPVPHAMCFFVFCFFTCFFSCPSFELVMRRLSTGVAPHARGARPDCWAQSRFVRVMFTVLVSCWNFEPETFLCMFVLIFHGNIDTVPQVGEMICMIYTCFMIQIFQLLMCNLAHVSESEPYNLHDLGHLSWVGSVLLRFFTASNKGRLGSR